MSTVITREVLVCSVSGTGIFWNKTPAHPVARALHITEFINIILSRCRVSEERVLYCLMYGTLYNE